MYHRAAFKAIRAAKREHFLDGFECGDLEWKLHEGVFGDGFVEQSSDEQRTASRSAGVSSHLHRGHGTGAEGFGQELESSKSGVESGDGLEVMWGEVLAFVGSKVCLDGNARHAIAHRTIQANKCLAKRRTVLSSSWLPRCSEGVLSFSSCVCSCVSFLFHPCLSTQFGGLHRKQRHFSVQYRIFVKRQFELW